LLALLVLLSGRSAPVSAVGSRGPALALENEPVADALGLNEAGDYAASEEVDLDRAVIQSGAETGRAHAEVRVGRLTFQIDSSCFKVCEGGACRETARNVSAERIAREIKTALRKVEGARCLGPRMQSAILDTERTVRLVCGRPEFAGRRYCGYAHPEAGVIELDRSRPGCVGGQTIFHELVHIQTGERHGTNGPACGGDVVYSCDQSCFGANYCPFTTTNRVGEVVPGLGPNPTVTPALCRAT
jgi:hypothetical protein